MLYKRYLGKQLGHERLEVYEASSGDEGLELFTTVRPDCILLDYNLLDTDGLAVLTQLQAAAPHDALCVVMITGGGNESLAVRALNSGALDYLVKQQFDRELLLKTVAFAIEKNEWRQYVARYHEELQTINHQLRDSLQELIDTRQEIQRTNAQLTAANEQIQARNHELDVTNQQLARTNADLDNFVYAASHDLRQPINNLRGLFDELQRTAVLNDPEATQVWRLVDESLHDLSTIITDLTAVVQIERLPGAQVVEQVDLADLTADVLQTLRPQLLALPAQIHTDFADLPNLLYLRSNLRTVLLNLLSNALKYSHPDRTPQIWLRSWLADGVSVLSVCDNGLGIDLQRHGAELFQLFRRFHPQAGEGTGVGLFLVNRLVQSNGGHIEVESQEGKGTTFRLFLSAG